MLILLKHGRTKGNPGIIKGHSDIELSKQGLEEAAQAAIAIKALGIRLDKIFCSDLKRAVETANIIGSALNLPVISKEILRERNAGTATNKLENEIDWKEYETKELKDRSHPAGESLFNVRTRAVDFLNSVKDEENLIVVSHDAFIKMLLKEFGKMSYEDAVALDITGKLIILDKKNGKIEFLQFSRPTTIDDHLLKFIKRYPTPGKALDLGAGDFGDVKALKQLGWDAFGVDLKTGIDLDFPYLSPEKPFDLVYSNFVAHKLKHPGELFKTARENLKPGGSLFIQTFDDSDENSSSKFTAKQLSLLAEGAGFINIISDTYKIFDNEKEHEHWHTVIQLTAIKP
jgi:broad specificity phosphatase PhoE